MQNLSSIHRLSQKFERGQGFGPWSGEWKNSKNHDFSGISFDLRWYRTELSLGGNWSAFNFGISIFQCWKIWKKLKIWKSGNFVENWRLLAQNDVQKCKIALLMQNWRSAGWWKWLVETACLLESNILYGPGHVGWPSGWELCGWNFWKSRFLDQFHQFKFARSIFPT